MSLADKIIGEVDAGAPYKRVADAYSWQAIGSAEKQRLFAEAASRSTNSEKRIALLYAVFRMAENAGDAWDSARAMALILRCPDVALTIKQRGLEHLRKTLNQVRSTLTGQGQASARRYKLYEADYYALKAEVTQEEGSLDRALVAYREAHAIWEKYGVKDKAEWSNEQIALLEDIAQSQQSLLPLEMLTSERTKLQEDIAKLQAEIHSTTEELSTLTERAQRLKDDTELLVHLG